MNEKAKIILIDSANAIASGVPGLNIAWGLSKALLGAGLKLRQQRALEWVEMIRDNPQIFIKELLEQEDFQDGFVYSLEKYLTERSEQKRKFIRNLFLGFTKFEKKEEFSLEKYIFIISQLDIDDIYTLKFVDVNSPNSYQVFDDIKCVSNIYNLINLGIIYPDPSSRLGNVYSPYVFTSSLGRNFIKYINYEN